MSDDPFSPYQPPDAPKPQPEPESPAPRPTSVTVFGILNLVFAGLGLCGTCVFAVQWSLVNAMPDQPPNPVFELMKENQSLYMFTIVSMGIGFVFTVLLGLAGFGLLKMRPWGRQLSIVYAVYTIIAAVVSSFANWAWMFGRLLEKADEMPAGPEQFVAIVTAYGTVFGGCFNVVYPIFLLIFMMRGSVVQAFRDQQGVSYP